MNRRRETIGLLLATATGVAMLAAVLAVFLYAPREATMGETQRIFYFHVASAWVGFFAFLVTLLGSIRYLRQRERRWDVLALSSVEIGLTFITMPGLFGRMPGGQFSCSSTSHTGCFARRSTTQSAEPVSQQSTGSSPSSPSRCRGSQFDGGGRYIRIS